MTLGAGISPNLRLWAWYVQEKWLGEIRNWIIENWKNLDSSPTVHKGLAGVPLGKWLSWQNHCEKTGEWRTRSQLQCYGLDFWGQFWWCRQCFPSWKPSFLPKSLIWQLPKQPPVSHWQNPTVFTFLTCSAPQQPWSPAGQIQKSNFDLSSTLIFSPFPSLGTTHRPATCRGKKVSGLSFYSPSSIVFLTQKAQWSSQERKQRSREWGLCL